MSYLVIDLETTILKHNKRAASPFHPDNAAVIHITKRANQETRVDFLPQFKDPTAEKVWPLHITEDTTIIVGHNLKFDLLYMWHLPELRAFLKRGGKIFDTQYAEYLLEGQQLHAQMCSMDSIAEKYGGHTKPNVVKAHWEQGICTRDIHEDVLLEYSIGDGDNTEAIFLGQLKRAAELHPNMIKGMMLRMDGLLATTEMEYNGLKVDQEEGDRQQAELAKKLQGMNSELEQYLPELPPEFTFNWQSRFHKSYLIFGGVGKYQRWTAHLDEVTGEPLYATKIEKWPLFGTVPVPPSECRRTTSGLYERTKDNTIQDTFKSGKRKGEGKTKNVTLPDATKPKGALKDYYITFKGYTKAKKEWVAGGTDAKGGKVYSTAEDVIELLGKRNVPFLKLMAERQSLTKDLGTYYWQEDPKTGERKGMLTLVNEFDGLLHHQLNHTSTVTTRLSSNAPNMQNIPRKDKSIVKGLFVSRFNGGKMGEVDYSQLEVIVQGWYTEDGNLRKDILEGIDFHCKRLAQKLGEDYATVLAKAKDETHEEHEAYGLQRTGVKGFSFQRAYGAGAPAISEATGLPVDEVQQLIEDEKVLYPNIEKFNAAVEKAVLASRLPTNERIFTNKGAAVIGIGEWYSPTGTRYVWREQESLDFMKDRGQLTSFSPPQLKNYPIQGGGGEVVQMVLGKLFRLFLATDNYDGKALLVNTVHDCVWFDMQDDVHERVINDAVRVMQAIPQFLKQTFEIDCGVMFRVDAEVGSSMLDLKHFHSPYYM